MKLSFITDEATQSLDEAIAFAKEYGLDGLELRSVDDRPIHGFSVDEVKVWKTQLDEVGLRTSNIAGSFFKSGTSPEEVEAELAKLAHLCELADALDCGTIRGFAFFAEGSVRKTPGELLPYYEKATEILSRYGKRLVLEADPSVNTSNHRALADLLKGLDETYYGAVYDPGNDLFDPLREVPYPDGYEAIRSRMTVIHIKDAVYDEVGEPRCCAPGTGLVGYPELIARLKADGYEGWMSLEPHYRKDTVLTEEQMRNPSGAAFTAGGMEAMKESATALKQLLQA